MKTIKSKIYNATETFIGAELSFAVNARLDHERQLEVDADVGSHQGYQVDVDHPFPFRVEDSALKISLSRFCFVDFLL